MSWVDVDDDPGDGLGNQLLALDGDFNRAVERVFDNMDSEVEEGFPNAGLHLFIFLLLSRN